jgi:signal transduction histidine kinase
MMFSMFVWVDFAYAARVYGTDYEVPLLFLRIAWFITPVFFTLLYFFTIYLIDEAKRYRKVSVAVLITGALLAIVCGVTNLVIDGFVYYPADTKLDILYGVGMLPFFAIVFLIICATLTPLFINYNKISKEEKVKIQFYMIGIFIFYIANTIFNIILPAFLRISQYYFFGDYSTIFFLILTAYAITKNNLMGVKALLTEVLIITMSIILVVDILFFSENRPAQIFKVFVLITFIYFGRELVGVVRRGRDISEKTEKANKDLEERNRDLHMLFGISSMVNRDLNSKKVAQDIADSAPRNLSYLGFVRATIALFDAKEDVVYVYAVTDSEMTRKIDEELGISVKNFREKMSSGDDLIIKTIKNKRIYMSADLNDFYKGFADAETNRKIQELLGAKSVISLPLFSTGKVIGAIIFSNKNNNDFFTRRNKDIATTFVSHIGPAIENSRLYEKTSQQIVELDRLNGGMKDANIQLEGLLEMKKDFLHITSHQLRTPLTAIRGMLSMWMDGDFENMGVEKKNEILHRIYISTERLNNITNDMLDALDLEGGALKMQFAKISLLHLLRDVVSTLQSDYDKKGLYLRFGEVEAEIPEVYADANYMSQVFMNLIDNSCKYTKEGGVEIGVKKAGDYVDVIIKDTGIGISAQDQKKIFEKFTRGENAILENASGSGLGLFVVKKILQDHKGKIEVRSGGIGKGTTFKVSVLINKS